MGCAIELNNLYWRYPSFAGVDNPYVIKGVNLAINSGEILGITGPSGSGKSTLCKLMLGVLPHGIKIPFQQINHHLRGSVKILGEISTCVDEVANVVDGMPLGILGGKGILSPKIGMVMQDPENQFLQMSVLHEIAFGLTLQSIGEEEIKRRSFSALKMVGLDYMWPDAENIHPSDLSGGQKQRVAIAAFLCMEPEILILDEPTSDLDPQGKYEIIQTIRKLKEDKGMTIILVEQDPELLYNFCDRIALLDEGQIISVTDSKKFYSNIEVLENHGVASFEISQIADSLNLDYGNQIPLTINEMMNLLDNKTYEFSPTKDIPYQTESVIEVNDVNYRYDDGTLALRGVNFKVNRGEIVSLLGMNGSGKTTIAKIIAGINTASSGSIKILNRDLANKKVRFAVPQWVGYVFQNPDHQLFTRKVRNEIEYGLSNLNVPPQERGEIIMKTLEIVGLSEFVDEDPLFLGKGQRQRLAVASVLAMGPEILIVDEPTTGQDHRMILGIMSLIENLHHQGKTILIITHDMNIVTHYCNRAVVLHDGLTIFDGTPRDLFVNKTVLNKSSLRPTQSVNLCIAMQKNNPLFPIYLNTTEWENGFSMK
ncbi:MAG: ABC transporter ATP-binding protein [Anaerolineaceae bacterium]